MQAGAHTRKHTHNYIHTHIYAHTPPKLGPKATDWTSRRPSGTGSLAGGALGPLSHLQSAGGGWALDLETWFCVVVGVA
jgi:hypothetical protein